MAQLRQNILMKDWVIIATERAKRPEQLKEDRDVTAPGLPEHDPKCPFCVGNEALVPPHLDEVRDGDAWQLRVVPNKFPALSPEAGELRMDTETCFRWMDGVGHHEVVIESPHHHLHIATMDEHTVLRVLESYKNRIDYLMRLPYVETVILFRNHGVKAGASLQHPHSQIIALPVTPRDIIYRMNESIRYHEEYRRCLFCHMLQSELAQRDRIILETEHFVAFVPYAAPSPFHFWIYPRRHAASYSAITEPEMRDLAGCLQRCLRKLHFGLNNPDYNYIFRSAPKGYGSTPSFHWYVTVVPRLTRSAGFELGSGMFINPSIPEENAAYLRSVEV